MTNSKRSAAASDCSSEQSVQKRARAGSTNSDSARSEMVEISLSGQDKPGIMKRVMEVLASQDCRICDITTATVQNTVTAVLLVETSFKNELNLIKELLFAAKTLDMTLDFTIHDSTRGIAPTALAHNKNAHKRHTLTVIRENEITSEFMSDLTKLLESCSINIDSINRLSHKNMSCIELNVSFRQRYSLDVIHEFKRDLLSLSKDHGTDVALQADKLFRRNKRLVVMDMDSTLIQQEVIDEIGRHIGIMDKIAKITHAAMNGEIDFNESLRQRCALLKGAPQDVYQRIIDNLIYTSGAHSLCRILKKLGYQLAVISGGFLPVVEHAKEELGLDYAFANTLEVGENGLLTGRVVGPIVNAQRKADILQLIAEDLGISLDQTIAIGDGANDLKMLSIAGVGIAFNAKPKVQEVAEYRINQRSLDNVLYLLGISDADARELLEQ